MYLNRTLDENGDPLGYAKMTGVKLLANDDMEAAFKKLPDKFRHKDAKETYGKGSQATTNFLVKCLGCGILKKNADGHYEKIDEKARFDKAA